MKIFLLQGQLQLDTKEKDIHMKHNPDERMKFILLLCKCIPHTCED